MTHVKLKNVSLTLFTTGKSVALSARKDDRVKHFKGYSEVLALSDISFNAQLGDKIGIIGRNGSGKTSLMRLLAGHLSATAGEIKIKGSVTPQISLGAGMQVNLSGRENAYLKCMYFNISQNKRASIINDIEEKSKLGEFFDMPMGTYSKGMRAKFIMSLLAVVGGEIIVIDEWVGAMHKAKDGGVNLQREIANQAKILFVASHSEAIIRSITNKCLLLDKGKQLEFGPTDEVLDYYKSME